MPAADTPLCKWNLVISNNYIFPAVEDTAKKKNTCGSYMRKYGTMWDFLLLGVWHVFTIERNGWNVAECEILTKSETLWIQTKIFEFQNEQSFSTSFISSGFYLNYWEPCLLKMNSQHTKWGENTATPVTWILLTPEIQYWYSVAEIFDLSRSQ